MLTRRSYLFGTLAGTLAAIAPNLLGSLSGATASNADGIALAPRTLAFPRDHGAHNDFRIEWWYLTGWLDPDPALDAEHDAALGFQVTFFRIHTAIDPANPSRFAAHQVLLAHAALADPARAALMQEQRISRTGFGIAAAAESDTDLTLDRWRFARAADGSYRCSLRAREFVLDLAALPTQPLLLQGEAGRSRKGPSPAQASYYYSQPQLAVSGTIERAGVRASRRGVAWLDHEWANTLLAVDAAGWDWLGMNLADGSALTAFQIRRRDDPKNERPLHAYASLRGRNTARIQTFSADEIRWHPLAQWHSARTGADWPVAQQIRIGARIFTTKPLFDDQELDSRAVNGIAYWEGASQLLEDRQPIGRGYLELTGYAAPMRR